MIRRLGIFILLLGLFAGLVSGCGSSEEVAAPPKADDNTFDGASVGRDETLEVVTWNLENFAKSGVTTVEYVIEAVEAMDADIVALQEISSASWFDQLVAGLDGWKGRKATSDRYMNLAFLYRDDASLSAPSFSELFRGDDAFPRYPYVMMTEFNDEPVIVINNHFKCCGDGYIDEENYWDEEYRRQRACVALEGQIREAWPDRRVLLVGDFNDSLTDTESRNVFQVFLDEPGTYRFVDMAIAEGPSSGWSWQGGGSSHLDHILVNEPLFAAVEGTDALVQVVPLDDYFDHGFSEYDVNISDHLPVALRVKLD